MISKLKRNIPNALTCGNLLCGCIGIDLCYQANLVGAAYLIGVAALFDFADGFVARLLNVTSPIGKQLDSLADMVSFGLLPGVIMMKLIYNGPSGETVYYISYLGLLIPVFSALRLAKFNIDERQSDKFIGLPTPANALMMGSLPLIAKFNPQLFYYFTGPPLLVLTIVMCILLVSELPLISLKFSSFSFTENIFRYLTIILSILFIFIFQFAGIPLAIFAYISLSIIENSTTKKRD